MAVEHIEHPPQWIIDGNKLTNKEQVLVLGLGTLIMTTPLSIGIILHNYKLARDFDPPLPEVLAAHPIAETAAFTGMGASGLLVVSHIPQEAQSETEEAVTIARKAKEAITFYAKEMFNRRMDEAVGFDPETEQAILDNVDKIEKEAKKNIEGREVTAREAAVRQDELRVLRTQTLIRRAWLWSSVQKRPLGQPILSLR